MVQRKNKAPKLYCRCGRVFCFLCSKEKCECNAPGNNEFGNLGSVQDMREAYKKKQGGNGNLGGGGGGLF